MSQEFPTASVRPWLLPIRIQKLRSMSVEIRQLKPRGCTPLRFISVCGFTVYLLKYSNNTQISVYTCSLLHLYLSKAGSGDSSMVRAPDSWLKGQSRVWIPAGTVGEFFSPVSAFCADSYDLYQYLFHPRVTAVARKRSRPFCQKRRWQVTAKHAYTLRIPYIHLCMMWHGAWLYGVHRTRAEMAAVSCGTSHASAASTLKKQKQKQNALQKASHSRRITCERSESAQESGE